MVKNLLVKYEKNINILLILVIIYNFLFNIFWVFLDQAPYQWDEAAHVLESIKHYEYFSGEISGNFWQLSDYYPNLTYTVNGLIMLLFSGNSLINRITTVTLFSITTLFLYQYLKDVLKDKNIALWTTIIFCLLPGIYQINKVALLETPLLFNFVVSLYFFHKSSLFKNTNYSLLTGIFFGLGMLTKWTYVIFILPVIAINLATMRWLSYGGRFLKNVLIFGITSVIIAAPWYLNNFNTLLRHANEFSTSELDDPTSTGVIIGWYINVLVKQHLLWPAVILVLIGLIYIFNQNAFIFYKMILSFTWIYVLLSIIMNKNDRYINPTNCSTNDPFGFWT